MLLKTTLPDLIETDYHQLKQKSTNFWKEWKLQKKKTFWKAKRKYHRNNKLNHLQIANGITDCLSSQFLDGDRTPLSKVWRFIKNQDEFENFQLRRIFLQRLKSQIVKVLWNEF